MSDGLNCLVASLPVDETNAFQGLVMFHVFVSLSFLEMLNVFECILMSPNWGCLEVVSFCWATKANSLRLCQGVQKRMLNNQNDHNVRCKQIFVEASHHQDVRPLCDEPWTPLAGLRGLSFSINNGVDLGACSKEVLISACSTLSVQHEYLLIINDDILPVR